MRVYWMQDSFERHNDMFLSAVKVWGVLEIIKSDSKVIYIVTKNTIYHFYYFF